MATASAAATVAVVQSPQDKRKYKRLRLDNGLDVLLIHDPEMADALEGGSDDNAEEDGYESDDEGDEEDEDDMEEDMADEVPTVSSCKPLHIVETPVPRTFQTLPVVLLCRMRTHPGAQLQSQAKL